MAGIMAHPGARASGISPAATSAGRSRACTRRGRQDRRGESRTPAAARCARARDPGAARRPARGRVPRERPARTLYYGLMPASPTLDAWVREVVDWHFDPATGCPFWLEFAAKAGWDPRR